MPSPPPEEGAEPRPGTRCVHGPGAPEPPHRPVVPPVHRASTYVLDEERLARADERGTPIYGRYGNPTVWTVERHLAALEGAQDALLTASGLAAIHAALLAVTAPGTPVLAPATLYGSTLRLLREVLAAAGRRVRILPDAEESTVRNALEPGAVLLAESLSNPLNQVADIPALAAAVHGVGGRLLVDATFATPVLQRPLELGADLVLHSASKALNGHSDVLAGVVAGPREDVRRAWELVRLTGACADPHAAWLLERGLRTLHLRVERSTATALTLARFLAGRPEVAQVHHPGLPAHPHHARARRLLPLGTGAIVAFRLRGGDAAAARFCRSLRWITEATSLGGVESLVSLPARTSHAALSPEERAAAGILPGTIRLAVGIEDPADLEEDLARALAASC